MKLVLPADTTFVQVNRAKRKRIILKHTSRFEICHFRCRPWSRPPLTYFAENDAFSLRSYRKTGSNLHICFGRIINHLSTFLELDIISKNMELRSHYLFLAR